ncbi:hypothetical protein A2773_05525 [Candidatus Gottesmanbacteria bacterium RIFCSPHIGHO2_01_FULL_39_10]|uniref:Uncharacterized protein n=1 Tax=Candidatus Gottesmanbacteria bacterium RIFCSPHIGHO2_01_FULL_39_10 TaxID=1798375 RepID=A0A1F5ZQ38_9BACT|nr:MAG: hypothetical protein A2773_05525 [Candidatus Gottesmanbacteria bacterium RIFCSPHIGHO2_01_FULL_39_10]
MGTTAPAENLSKPPQEFKVDDQAGLSKPKADTTGASAAFGIKPTLAVPETTASTSSTDQAKPPITYDEALEKLATHDINPLLIPDPQEAVNQLTVKGIPLEEAQTIIQAGYELEHPPWEVKIEMIPEPEVILKPTDLASLGIRGFNSKLSRQDRTAFIQAMAKNKLGSELSETEASQLLDDYEKASAASATPPPATPTSAELSPPPEPPKRSEPPPPPVVEPPPGFNEGLALERYLDNGLVTRSLDRGLWTYRVIPMRTSDSNPEIQRQALNWNIDLITGKVVRLEEYDLRFPGLLQELMRPLSEKIKIRVGDNLKDKATSEEKIIINIYNQVAKTLQDLRDVPQLTLSVALSRLKPTLDTGLFAQNKEFKQALLSEVTAMLNGTSSRILTATVDKNPGQKAEPVPGTLTKKAETPAPAAPPSTATKESAVPKPPTPATPPSPPPDAGTKVDTPPADMSTRIDSTPPSIESTTPADLAKLPYAEAAERVKDLDAAKIAELSKTTQGRAVLASIVDMLTPEQLALIPPPDRQSRYLGQYGVTLNLSPVDLNVLESFIKNRLTSMTDPAERRLIIAQAVQDAHQAAADLHTKFPSKRPDEMTDTEIAQNLAQHKKFRTARLFIKLG